MKMSMTLLARFLQHHNPICNIKEDARTISGVRLISEQSTEFNPEFVHVGPTALFFTDKKYEEGCILVSGHSNIVCGGCRTEDLLNEVLAAFEYHNACEVRLNQLALEHAPLADMYAVFEPVARVPFFAFSVGGQLIAHRVPDAPLSPQLQATCARVLGDGSSTSELINKGTFDAQGNLMRDLPDYPLMVMTAPNADRVLTVSSYILHQGKRLGYCSLHVESESDGPLLVQIEELLLPFFVHADEFTRSDSPFQPTALVMQRLLAGEQLLAPVLERFQAETGLGLPLRLVRMQAENVINHAYRMRLCAEINRVRSQGGEPCFAVERDNEVVALCGSAALAALELSLAPQIRTGSLRAGASMPFFSFDQVKTAFGQAGFALEYADVHEETHLDSRTNAQSAVHEGVSLCEDHGFDYLLNVLRRDESALQMLHPAVAALADYDDKNGTELLETLRVLLRCGGNQVEAARVLCIHRNTCKYRIARILEITGLDLDDAAQRDYLVLSLYLTR